MKEKFKNVKKRSCKSFKCKRS